MLFISVFILIIVVWAGIIVASKLPRIEMLTRGVYEELKRVSDELEHRNRGNASSTLLCRNCAKPLAANERFCGECGHSNSYVAANA